MIIKEFQINKKIIDNHNFFLFYGINEGLKDEIIQSKFKNQKEISFKSTSEVDVLKNVSTFFDEITSKSFFDNKKIILINNVTNKLLNIIEQILEKKIFDITFILNAGLLDKKSKIRNLFETNKNLICIPFYEDKVITIENLIKQFFISNKVKVSQEIINLIINKSSGNRKILQNELKKIEPYLINKSDIKLDELKILLNSNEELNISDLVNYCLLKNERKTLFLLNENNFYTEDMIIIVRTFLSKVKKLLTIRNNKNDNIENLIDHFKPPIFWKEKPIIKEQLSKWSNKSLFYLLEKINKTEYLIKANQNNSKNILLNFIFETLKTNNSSLKSR